MPPLRLDSQSCACLNTTLQSESVTATSVTLMESRLKRLEANFNYLEAKLEIQNEANNRVEEKMQQIVEFMTELQNQHNELKETVEKFVQNKASSDMTAKDQSSFESTLSTLDSKQNSIASSPFKQILTQPLNVSLPQVQEEEAEVSLLDLYQQMQNALSQQGQMIQDFNQLPPHFSTFQKIQQQNQDASLPERVLNGYTKPGFELPSDDSQEAVHLEQVTGTTVDITDLLFKKQNGLSKDVDYTEKKRVSTTKNFSDSTKQGSNLKDHRSDWLEVSVDPPHYFKSRLEIPSCEYVSTEKPRSQADILRASQRVVETIQNAGKQHRAKERRQSAQMVQDEWLLRNKFDKNGKANIDEETRLPAKKLPSSFSHRPPLSKMTHFSKPKLSNSSATSAKKVFSNVHLYKWVENNVSKIAVGDLTLIKNNLPFIKLVFVSSQDDSQEFYLKPSDKPKVIEGRKNSVMWRDLPKNVMSQFVSEVYITKFATKGDADRFIKLFECSKA